MVFQLGDKVLLKLQPYAQTSLVNRPFPKLSMKYYVPYTVLERIGPAAYKLDLPASSSIHPTFHVSQLKAYTPDHTPVFSDIIRLPDLTAHLTEPETILERRLVKKGNSAVPQVLVKWSQLPTHLLCGKNSMCCRRPFLQRRLGGKAVDKPHLKGRHLSWPRRPRHPRRQPEKKT